MVDNMPDSSADESRWVRFPGSAEIMEEIAMAVPQYAGISHQRLEGEGILVARPDTDNPLPVQVLYSDKEYRGIQWPCTTRSHIGTPILYADGLWAPAMVEGLGW